MIKQITVFLENKPGRMEEVTGCLAENGINIHALSLADTTDFGILRMIVSDVGKAVDVLKEASFMVKVSDVVAVALGHSPGSLFKVLHELKTLDVSIEYMYAFTGRHKEHAAIVILSLADQEDVSDKLKKSNLTVLGSNLLDELE